MRSRGVPFHNILQTKTLEGLKKTKQKQSLTKEDKLNMGY